MRRNIMSRDKLLIIWSGTNREVALNMINKYALNAKNNNWWDEITLLIWGPSCKVLSVDSELQESIRNLKEAGVNVATSRSCTDNYSVTAKLMTLGLNVNDMGEHLTQYLKNGWKTITF